MTTPHQCIGGPLDGQTVTKPDHVKRFVVAVNPKPFALFDPSAASAPVDKSIETVTYTLTRNRSGVLEWVAA
jgi:hypothetical protein